MIHLEDYPIDKEIFEIFNDYALEMLNTNLQRCVWIGGSLSLRLNGIDLGRMPKDIDVLFNPDEIDLFSFVENCKDFTILEKKPLYVRTNLSVYKCLYKSKYNVDVISSYNKPIYNYENHIGVESPQNVISAKQELIKTYYNSDELYITKKAELKKHCRDVALINNIRKLLELEHID